jgi:hypothetical protein
MANAPIDRPPVMARVNAAFCARHADYNDRHDGFRGRLAELNARLDALIRARRVLPASEQMALEAQWLINYSDDWDRAQATLDRLDKSLAGPDQPALAQQADGSWAPGYTEWYRKLEPTIDALQEHEIGSQTHRPLAFMTKLQDPDFTVGYLDGLRVSRIRETGRNNRDEFGAVLTALSQLIFKRKLRKVLIAHPELAFNVSPDLEARYKAYLWAQQSDLTGYWGPAYNFDGEAIEVQDLSFTFHVVHYYDDGQRTDLPKLDKIVDTTLAIEDFIYPNGWRPEPSDSGPAPPYSDHNNYDVVTLFASMWRVMSPDLRAQARTAIRKLLAWCLTRSLQGDEFAPNPGVSRVDSYYYGVKFLQAVGFWQQASAFWTDGGAMPLPDGAPPSTELADRLLKKFRDDVDDHSEAAETTIEILEAAQAPSARPSV